MSKGSKRRPLLVDQRTFDENWERIFGGLDFSISLPDSTGSVEPLDADTNVGS